MEFHEHQFFDAREGFERLGSRFLLVGECVAVAPSTSNVIRMMARIERRITAVDDVELIAGSAEFIREEAAALAIMPHIDLSEIAEATEQLWIDEIDRRG